MMLTPDDRRKTLEFEYQEICRSHAAITDFRGKLLTLLPLASGAGLFLLLEATDPEAPLLAIGAFGCAVTLGLGIYELRNIEECNELIGQGRRIEHALEVPKGTQRFGEKPEARLNGLLGATGASWIVYTAIFCGWLFVAVRKSWLENSARWWVPALFVAVLLVNFVLVPLAKTARQKRKASQMLVSKAVNSSFERGRSDRFTGEVWLRSTVAASDGTRIGIVHFTPGSRTHWHRHSGGQFLYIMTGRARVHTCGGTAHVLDPGDVCYVDSRSWHFHGAGPDTPMAHLVVTGGGSTEWGRAVTPEEYSEALEPTVPD